MKNTNDPGIYFVREQLILFHHVNSLQGRPVYQISFLLYFHVK